MLLPVPSVRFPIRFIPVRQGIGIILVPQFFIFLCSSFIITAQTLRKDGRTHSVRNDMVHIDQKEPAFLSILPQSGPKQGRFSQTEGPADLFHHFLKGISLQNRKGKRNLPADTGKDPVVLLHKGCPENPIARNHLTERLLQLFRIHFAADPESAGHMIGKALRVHTGLYINPLLDGRERITVKLRRRAQLLLMPFFPSRLLLPADKTGQPFRAAAGIQIGNAQQPSCKILQPGQNLHGIQGIASAKEIIIILSHLRLFQNRPENLQHLSGKDIVGGGGNLHILPGQGQTFFIHLAAGRQRQPVKPDKKGRDHIFRQISRRIGKQLHLRYPRIAAVIGSQDHLSVHLTHPCSRFLHTGIGRNAVRHLLRFNTQPAQLHLSVQAACQKDFTLRSPGRHIPCGINPFSGFKRILKKAFFRQFRGIPVSSPHADAADVQLSVNTHRLWIHPLIQHIHPAVRHRFSHSDGRSIAQLLHAHRHGRFRWPVLIINPGAGTIFKQLKKLSGKSLPAADYAFHPVHGTVKRRFLQKCREPGRRYGQEAHRIPGD